jgi:hypothetical protein
MSSSSSSSSEDTLNSSDESLNSPRIIYQATMYARLNFGYNTNITESDIIVHLPKNMNISISESYEWPTGRRAGFTLLSVLRVSRKTDCYMKEFEFKRIAILISDMSELILDDVGYNISWRPVNT